MTAAQAAPKPAAAPAAPPAAAPLRRAAARSIVTTMLVAAALGMLLVATAAMVATWYDLDLVATAALAAGAIGLGLAVSAWVGQRIARTLEGLTQEAEALRALDTSRPLPVASGLAELDRLGDAMRQMKKSLGVFGIYVPRDLVRQLVAHGSEARLGGERRVVTVMFTDVQDFTRIAERMEPEELMRVTSGYFETVTAELLHSQATIDKYVGDAVMALWNAPRRDLAHALHACRGALRARAATRDLARRFAARGWPQLYTRFGLHTGEAVVGNVGSSDRMSYTAIGAMVNLASRLEGLNKFYGTQILVSEATARGAGSGFLFRPIDLVTPRGTTDPVEILELVGLARAREPEDEPLLADRVVVQRLPAWREMVQCYRKGRFADAEAALEEAGGAAADPVAAIYAERLARLRAAPPGPDWSPVIAHDSK